jgi:hypothetical protein
MSRIVTRLAAVTAAAALPVLGIAAANASSTPKSLTGGSLAVTSGVAGYYDHSVNIRMGDIHAQANLSLSAANLLGMSTVKVSKYQLPQGPAEYVNKGSIAGAAGLDLCNNSSGQAVQFGAIYVGNGEWNFGFAGGNAGSPNNQNPACQTGILTAGGNTFIATDANGNPITETTGAQVRMEISTGKTSTPQGNFRWVDFSVYDMTTGLVDWNSGRIPFFCFTPGDAWPQFYQAGAGVQQVQQSTQYVLSGSPVATVPFTYTHVADYAGQGQYLLGRWPTTAVATVDTNGNLLVFPQGLAGGHFTDYSLPVVGS